MMLTNKARRISLYRQLILAAFIVVGAVSAVSAKNEGPTPSEMLANGMTAMQSGNYDDAIQYMYMYLSEVDKSTQPRVVAIAQDVRFKLSSLLIQQKRLDEASSVLQEYIDAPLANKPRQALKMLVTCYFETEAYEECVTAVTNALYYNENPVVLSETVSKRKGDDDEEDDEDYSKEKVEPEEEYTDVELTSLNMSLAESYYKIGQWSNCVEPFSYVIEHTSNEQRKGYSIMQVINALIEGREFTRILSWVPQLYRTDARFDIRVNLALMNAAATLIQAEEYDAALPLYRMILPRDELIKYQESRIRDLRIAAGMAPDEGAQLTDDEMLLFGGDDTGTETVVEVEAEDDEKPKELAELETLIAALRDMPAYELDNKYRMADLYKTVERYWEALKFFEMVYVVDPTTEIGEHCIYELVDMLIENLDDIKEAEKRGFEYMDQYKEGMTPRQIAYMLTGYYQSHDAMATIKTLKPYIDSFVRTNNVDVLKYDTELYFMQAVSDLVSQDYVVAEKSFKYVLDEFPDSHQEGNSIYWYSMSQLFQQKYAEAQPNFERYVTKYPSEQYVDECSFQIGICLFGQEDYLAASNQFSKVIASYPTSSIFPDACSMRGDIYGSEGMLDEAISDYERAYATAKRINHATYATFQMADVYEAEDKYDDIIRVVTRYKDDYPEEADIAKALFWIGKTMIQQKRYEDAVDTYVDAIIQYGNDLRQDGVDLMITELVKISNMFLDTDMNDALVADLTKAMESTSRETLKLRLRVTLAKITNTELELGKALLAELKTFDNASPPVLAAICDASFENEDYSRSEELLRIFINKFEDSDFMRAAYKLRGFGQYDEKDYDGTLFTINEAQSLYGTDRDVAWAQLLKAQVLLDQGNINDARDENMSVLTVPSWRGVPVAQATYQLGQVETEDGNLAKAHGFYQRTYMQYKGHARGYWAAEAYLGAANVLKKMGLENDVRNTYRAMLFDRYVKDLPQADIAREYLGSSEVAEIGAYLETGGVTNISVSVEAEMTGATDGTTKSAESDEKKENDNTSATEEGA